MNTTLTTGVSVRAACRAGSLTGPTPGLAPGYVQANLVILPRDWATDFHAFCVQNPQPCPLLEMTAAGDPEPHKIAPGADVRTDLPSYRVWREGVLIEERLDIRDLWQDDLVSFYIGCSFTFERALQDAGLFMRHIDEGRNVPMYVTNRDCTPAGRFHGKLVVSMRPLTREQGLLAAAICAKMPLAHGAPIHHGDAAELGINDVMKPDFGDAVTIRDGELPMFWACGVTPQAALMAAKPPFAITHSPGHMFLTDLRDQDLMTD